MEMACWKNSPLKSLFPLDLILLIADRATSLVAWVIEYRFRITLRTYEDHSATSVCSTCLHVLNGLEVFLRQRNDI